jgi:hypothetical protein
MVDTVLEVGASATRCSKPAVVAPHHGRRRAGPPCACVRDDETTHPVHLALDVRFDAVTPAIGTDGQPSGGGGPKSAQAAAAAGTVGKGHLEQAGRWTGWLEVDGVRHEWQGAHGNRDRSWGPRRWGGPKMWRWFSINVGDDMHFGGIRLGTDAGDLHRGWVWDGDRATSVAEWRLRTELADDGVTHQVVHLQVVDKKGRTYDLRGDVLRVADIGRAGGTMVNEGLARWTYEDPDGPRAPATASASTCTSSTTAGGLSSPSNRWPPAPPRAPTTEVAAALGRRLGGTVSDLRRLSGGASRITSSFDLVTGGRTGGAPAHPAAGPGRRYGRSGRVNVEAALLRAAAAAGVPVPEVVAWATGGRGDGSGTGWLVVERMEGETIPRKILRDPEWARPAPR